MTERRRANYQRPVHRARPRRAAAGAALAVLAVLAGVLATAAPAGAATRPGAPSTIPTTAPLKGSAIVAWSPPRSNGGSAIRRYVATATPGGRTCTSTTRFSCTVLGLTNGVTYRFSVRAYNGVGPGPASALSGYTLVGVPTRPLDPSAISLAASARVAWRPPLSKGGAPIVRTVATATPGGRTCTTAGTTCVVTGLRNGTTYRFTIASSNAFGTGPGQVATTGPVVVGTPSPPRNLRVTCVAPGTPRISGDLPLSPGASPILRFEGRGTANLSGLEFTQDWTSVGLALSYQVAGFLVPKGVRIFAEVRAVNAVGAGAAAPIRFTAEC